MNIKSPNERAQHIAEMAYRHIYKPSEEGKRVEVLLDKMFLPQNAYCYAMFPKWFADSKVKTNEADRVRYIMGRLCAYLHHFYDKPSVEDFEKGFDYSNMVKFQRHCENALNSVFDPKDDGSIYNAMYPLSKTLIKRLHLTLKNGTSDSRKDWFAVGEYKRVPNEVGGRDTTAPEKVEAEISELLSSYNAIQNHTLEQIIAFHHDFEYIHPFQDGNGRIGRLILFKECLKNNIVPFIIEDDLKMFYYRGLHKWNHEHGYLVDTCLTAQDRFKAYLDYFRIPYGG